MGRGPQSATRPSQQALPVAATAKLPSPPPALELVPNPRRIAPRLVRADGGGTQLVGNMSRLEGIIEGMVGKWNSRGSLSLYLLQS